MDKKLTYNTPPPVGKVGIEMTNQDKSEYELLKETSFDREYESDIPEGYYALYLANPKNRWRRNQINHALVDRLINTHSVTFTNLMMLRYGEFYVFKIDKQMEMWGLNKLTEFCHTHPGVHFSCNIWPGEYVCVYSPNTMEAIRKEEEARVERLRRVKLE